MKIKNLLLLSITFSFLIFLLLKTNKVFANEDYTNTYDLEEQLVDIHVIPDKYNTGSKGNLTVVTGSGIYDGVKFEGTTTYFAMYFNKVPNINLSEETIIDSYDFSAFDKVTVSNLNALTTQKTIIFKNCKFQRFVTSSFPSNLKVIFENCTMTNFTGCDATLKNCYIGGTWIDGINPISNVNVIDCYIADISVFSDTKAAHTDGIQTNGYIGSDVFNIYLYNCRFETPIIPMTGNKAGMNAVLFINPEQSNGYNIKIDNCIINGGVFSISVSPGTEKGFTLDNETTILSNIKVGSAKKFGTYYPNQEMNAIYSNITDTDKLYVGSVWKEDGNIHISVSNDASVDRKLIVVTPTGQYELNVNACYQSNLITESDNLTFESYPFDIDFVIPDADSVICYDTSINEANRIRYVKNFK